MPTRLNIDFSGKTVVITGATRGIGKSIADLFKDAGAELILTGTKISEVEKLNQQVSGNEKIKYLCLDFLKEETVSEFLEYLKGVGKIDVLINNAGINRINYVYDALQEDWNDMIKVNLTGPFILTKQISAIMKKNNYGRIINIASIFGSITREKRSVYTTTKAGIIGFTKTTAVDLAPYNILVNAVSPGFILTDLTKNILSEKELEDLAKEVPLGRFGSPEEIAKVVLFIASDLNTFITGQDIIADGGYINV